MNTHTYGTGGGGAWNKRLLTERDEGVTPGSLNPSLSQLGNEKDDRLKSSQITL